jgi:hypothetical protein
VIIGGGLAVLVRVDALGQCAQRAPSDLPEGVHQEVPVPLAEAIRKAELGKQPVACRRRARLVERIRLREQFEVRG